jgi:hypothetical protein
MQGTMRLKHHILLENLRFWDNYLQYISDNNFCGSLTRTENVVKLPLLIHSMASRNYPSLHLLFQLERIN